MGLTYNPMQTCCPKHLRMSFNVTQCPACESTFNTNSRVLAVAAGKVRCGACLNVFEAIDHFLIPEEDDAELTQGESVFVGNNPQEYFDPSRFLTRSALRESQHPTVATADPLSSQNLHGELEQSEIVNEEFFNTVAEELHDAVEPSVSGVSDFIEPEAPAAEPPQKLLEHKPVEEVDDAFEDEILASFSEEAETEADAEAVAATESAAEPFSPAREEPRDSSASLQEPLPEETPPLPAEPAPDSNDATVGLALSASFSFGYLTPPTPVAEDSEAAAKQPDEQIESPLETSPETAGELETESEARSSDEDEEQFLSSVAEELEQDPQTPGDSEWPPADKLDSPEQVADAEEAALKSELAETLSSGADEETETETETKTKEYADAPTETPGDETLAANPDALASIGETQQHPEAEAVDESTEAIRARALETELNDEDALEAIPQENLAALGAMSSPVELLAGKESRLLRSSLLLLCIVLLGGLLGGQVLWQRMELYSQLPQLRAVYEYACSITGCELPEFSDIGAIRSENLTVQTHPTLVNGLMVNTVIRNTAAFEQPFPILILSFNSAANSIIALREFTPAEYLDTGLRSVQAMPPNTPVQISLAIMDPGPQAVNYTLAFRLP